MNPGKTIIIGTHQLHDVEHLLDHVVIIDRNKVLLNQPVGEGDEPVSLEELFIDTLTHSAL
jgi:ABC-2 type transport system ATP-binding protein